MTDKTDDNSQSETVETGHATPGVEQGAKPKWSKAQQFIDTLKAEKAALQKEFDDYKVNQKAALAKAKYGSDVVDNEDVQKFFEKYPDGDWDDAVKRAWLSWGTSQGSWGLHWAGSRENNNEGNTITSTRYEKLTKSQQKERSDRTERGEATIDRSK